MAMDPGISGETAVLAESEFVFPLVDCCHCKTAAFEMKTDYRATGS